MSEARILDGIIWTICGLTALTVGVWVTATDFEFHVKAALLPVVAVLTCLVVRSFYTSFRRDPNIAAMMTALVQLVVFTLFGGTLSYLIASLDRPLWDATLFQWDLALGLEWRAYLDWVNAHPVVGTAFTIAYRSIQVQMMVLILSLGVTGQIRDLRIFMAGIVVTGLVIILWSGFTPAMAMFVHLGLTPGDYPNLAPAAAAVHVEAMYGLRDGSLRSLTPLSFEGIITFPSYHAALGVVFLRAFWAVPWLRWPGAVLNITMIAATPIDGGHYFVDVIFGVAIATVAIVACGWLGDKRATAGSVGQVQCPALSRA